MNEKEKRVIFLFKAFAATQGHILQQTPIGKDGFAIQNFDSQKAARVWNRVQGHSAGEFDVQSLPELIAQELRDANAYLQLSRRFQGRDSVLLRQMAQQEQDHAACLKGLYTLITGQQPKVPTTQNAQQDVGQLLRGCYGNQMHRLARYEARAGESQYGHIFSRLAQQEQEQCHRLLALLGRLKK